ncbi:uncharacterized protein LOC113790548 isoform X2 [Dermatophagoides pteronyssinus]
MTKLKFKTMNVVNKSSANELDRLALVENMSSTQTIHNLLNELNHYGTMVNECSKKKSSLIEKLQNEFDQINEISKIPVLDEYFQLLFNLELCQQKIERYEMEISDISSELYMTQLIIVNMLEIEQQTQMLANSKRNSSSKSSLDFKKNVAKKINKKSKQNSILNNDDGDNNDDVSNRNITQSNNSLNVLRNLFKFRNRNSQTNHKNYRNCSLRSNKSLIDDGDLNEKMINDPYVETIEHLKMKSKLQHKHRQLNEKCLQQLIIDCFSLKQKLKHYYQKHHQELSANADNLDQYFRYRVRTNDLQTKIVQMNQSIDTYRQQYRNTMDQIHTLSNSIHKSRNGLRDIQS